MIQNSSLHVSEQQLCRQRDYMHQVGLLNQEFEATHGRAPRCFTHTYGCQQNENDTEKINGMLMEMGFRFTSDKKDADLILLNTCAVREHAEQKVLGNVGALVHLKRNNPDLMICLCGCMMSQEHVWKNIKARYPHVDLVFGTHALYRFPENLFRLMTSHRRVFDTEDTNGVIVEGLPIRRDSSVKAWVSVMSGCNNFCSYCIVPYVRGRERSRNPEDVLAEVRGLVQAGYKDITLLGQNVNSYSKDLGIDYDFSDLLRDINAIDGDFCVKFMTSHPKDASHKLLDTVAECEKLVKHVHLPFQSGSDRILKQMNRHYTRQTYLDLVEYAKEKIPDVAITSDVIVGFPGETEDDFEQTLDLVRKVRFHGLYTFLYSPRQGTPAAQMPDQISKEVKAERFQRLVDPQTEICTEIHSEYIGQVLSARVDGPAEKSENVFAARTQNNTIVHAENVDNLSIVPGQTIRVRVDKALNWAIFGKIVKE